ncbi:hypothetical protein PSU4_15460 [Pseudonocardia sulfidoxydans NBRC 16205]|uniref:Uncharacterized protein n=1 Tax=Pseudonocardia sulfidoxydans NBRC 16205 TaxID=1223511 RepID=A0A511DCS2_9PSEU|nr:hypothetical protein PSU4_15460 [Pseudonocardia sulfidoxydans NBRC 16205]
MLRLETSVMSLLSYRSPEDFPGGRAGVPVDDGGPSVPRNTIACIPEIASSPCPVFSTRRTGNRGTGSRERRFRMYSATPFGTTERERYVFGGPSGQIDPE